MSILRHQSRRAVMAGLSLASSACGEAPDTPASCAARFASLSENKLIDTGQVRATYTYDLTRWSTERATRLIKPGGNGRVASMTVTSGDTGQALRAFKAKPVDALGALLMAERRYYRVRPDRATTASEAVRRGCALLGPEATLIAIDLTMT